jgi:hypothetical protein
MQIPFLLANGRCTDFRTVQISELEGRYRDQLHLIALLLTESFCFVALSVYSDLRLGWDCARESSRRLRSMRDRPLTLAYAVLLMLGMARPAVAQDNGVPQPSARQQPSAKPQGAANGKQRFTFPLEERWRIHEFQVFWH